jgi:Fic family protein
VARNTLPDEILGYLAARAAGGQETVAPRDIERHTEQPRATLNRALVRLVEGGRLVRLGKGRAVVYRLPQTVAASVTEAAKAADTATAAVSPQWSDAAKALREALNAPLGTRTPVTYQRRFVDEYIANQSFLLPAALADDLFASGRAAGQQPAGTFARKVLQQLDLDLSWHSSRLEGNRKSLLDTKELFARGRGKADDPDATMLLNHKDAIEFLVNEVPNEGITVPVVRNLQAALMRDLLDDPRGLGAIRSTIVHIQDSVYLPSQVPTLLAEMLEQVVAKAREIRNPIEAAFFLWVNIAYLQPFQDGNKRTSRLAANMPLLLANCAPLSFQDVEPDDYALAMMGVYERLDVTLAVELFRWTYRRSIPKYKVILESMGMPDPLRARYREELTAAVQQVVFYGGTAKDAIAALDLPESDVEPFTRMLAEELDGLAPYNCARYRLSMKKTEQWIAAGRPR